MDLTIIHAPGRPPVRGVRGGALRRQTQTYEQLYERSCRLANALKELGGRARRAHRHGSATTAQRPVEQMAGIALGGYVRTALYTHNSGESNLYLLDLVEASVLIVEAKHYDAVAPHLADAASVRHVPRFGGDTPPARATTSRRLRCGRQRSRITLLADDPHVIRFSAGTTGKPKGILHTVAGWRGVATEMTLAMPRMDQNDRYLAAGPLSHAAMLPIFGTLSAGGTIVVMRAFQRPPSSSCSSSTAARRRCSSRR